MLDLVLASVCVCVLVYVGVSSAHFQHFHFQRSQPASHREVPFHRSQLNIATSSLPPRTAPDVALKPSRIPETNSLDDAICYWTRGSPEKGLMVPLSQWGGRFRPAEYSSEHVKLSNIRFVYNEFAQQCGGDFGVFEQQYPGLCYKFTKLFNRQGSSVGKPSREITLDIEFC